MSLESIKNQFSEALKVLKEFNEDPENFQRIEEAGNLLVESFRAGGKTLSCGNGGSMCDSMHFAEELTGRYRDDRQAFPAIAISDPSHITCVGNDYGFDHIFSRYVEAHGNANDVLLAISSSGNSKNVILAMEEAKRRGMKIIALTGKDGGKMAPLADVEIRAPFAKYADRAQEVHIKIIHTLIDFVEQNY